jgi:hypothetical protein
MNSINICQVPPRCWVPCEALGDLGENKTDPVLLSPSLTVQQMQGQCTQRTERNLKLCVRGKNERNAGFLVLRKVSFNEHLKG